MKIEPTYATLAQAKLLKQKGFSESCLYWYGEEDAWGQKSILKIPISLHTHKNSKAPNNTFSAPEHWMVVEWLRLEHSIWVSVQIAPNKKPDMFWYRINTLKDMYTGKNLDSPQAAYSAAFDYTLNNLL